MIWNYKKKPWEYKRDFYSWWFIFFLAIFLLGIIMPSGNIQLKNLQFTHAKTLKSYKYGGSNGPKSGGYKLTFYLKNNENQLVLSSMDYQNFRHEDFKKKVKKGDVVTIGYIKHIFKNSVYSFQKYGIEYCDLGKANQHRWKNKLWLLIMAGYGWLICLIPLLYKKESKIRFDLLLIIGLVLIFYLLTEYIGIQYITLENYE